MLIFLGGAHRHDPARQLSRALAKRAKIRPCVACRRGPLRPLSRALVSPERMVAGLHCERTGARPMRCVALRVAMRVEWMVT